MPADPNGWLEFANADLQAARLLIADSSVPSRIACFHAQQAAEKALKASLIEAAILFRKTHDIVVLVGLAPLSLAALLAQVEVLILQPWAVDGRYPGDLPDATAAEAAEAVAVSSRIVDAVKTWLEATRSNSRD